MISEDRKSLGYALVLTSMALLFGITFGVGIGIMAKFISTVSLF